MSDLLDLAARCEQATGPDRELDIAIHKATFAGDPLDPWAGFGDFSRSLDAAMSLVPEGWSVSIGDLRGYDPPLWRAHLRDHRPESLTKAGRSQHYVEGNTSASPALALCAAALRARTGLAHS